MSTPIWFRFYNKAAFDPKVQRLPGEKFKLWVNLLCLASDNGGVLPCVADIAFIFHKSEEEISNSLDEFYRLGLFDEVELEDAPKSFTPHNWEARQYKSDVSTGRVKRFRDKQRNVSVVDGETPPEKIQSKLEAEDIPVAVAPVYRDEDFEEFWKAYPRRDGANPKEPAAKLFRAAVRAGTPAAEVIAGARQCAVADAKNVGTPYIPQAVKWLRDKRWRDYQSDPPEADKPPDWDNIVGMYVKLGIWSKHAPGPDPDSPACQAPKEILAKHGITV